MAQLCGPDAWRGREPDRREGPGHPIQFDRSLRGRHRAPGVVASFGGFRAARWDNEADAAYDNWRELCGVPRSDVLLVPFSVEWRYVPPGAVDLVESIRPTSSAVLHIRLRLYRLHMIAAAKRRLTLPVQVLDRIRQPSVPELPLDQVASWIGPACSRRPRSRPDATALSACRSVYSRLLTWILLPPVGAQAHLVIRRAHLCSFTRLATPSRAILSDAAARRKHGAVAAPAHFEQRAAGTANGAGPVDQRSYG